MRAPAPRRLVLQQYQHLVTQHKLRVDAAQENVVRQLTKLQKRLHQYQLPSPVKNSSRIGILQYLVHSITHLFN